MRPGAGAVLVPAINTAAWELGLDCRVALFRDWSWDDEEGRLVDDARLAQIIKTEGIAVPEGRARLAGFSIADVCHVFTLPLILNPEDSCLIFIQNGLTLLTLPTLPTLTSPHAPAPLIPSTTTTPTLPLPLKRKLSATDLEIPDSEGEDDEDYGWAEEDEEDVPPPPPQWQGSEDHLAPGEGGELEAEEIDVELNFEDELVEGGGNGEQKERSGIARTEIEDSEDELAL
jgi:hypothetical protein